MLVSYKWLQTFFNGSLPIAEEVAHALMFGAFEVDGVNKKGEDTIIDVKVLPNRAHDSLSHRGIAREASSLLDVPMVRDPLSGDLAALSAGDSLHASVEDQTRAPLYALALVRGVKIGPSPEWLRERLESIGERSINNVVDATNYVMFELGTPLHAFDAAALSKDGIASVSVRPARRGEKIAILGGKEYELSPEETVIANGHTDEPIAIAGVKGGMSAELSGGTVDIVLEAAKFDPVRTRRAARRLDLRTEASKRFENEIADDLPLYGLSEAVRLIVDIAGGEHIEDTLVRTPPSTFTYMLGVSSREANDLLGTALEDIDIERVLTRLGFWHERIDPLQRVLNEAREHVGKPYVYWKKMSESVPHAFDCSSLTAYLFARAGISIPRVTVDQYLWGEPVKKEDLKPGDLIFSNSGEGKIWTESCTFIKGKKVPDGVDHVGLYLGEGKVLHASKKVGFVVEEDLQTSEGFKTIVGYRRIVEEGQMRFVIRVPFERLDLRIPADLIEEIGRVYGYEHIGALPLERDMAAIPDPLLNAAEAVRGALSKLNFDEIYTYSLRNDGVVKLSNPLSSDKGTMRADLTAGLRDALKQNAPNMPLLGGDELRLFEIGNVFPGGEKEEMHVAIGAYAPGRNGSEQAGVALEEAKRAIEGVLGGVQWNDADGISEFDLSSVALPESMRKAEKQLVIDGHAVYRPISPYPFVLRDIALWVPEQVLCEDVADVIRAHAGPLLARIEPFDTFKKDGRTSFAFHLVFQSGEKTLTDQEVNGFMQEVERRVKEKGWEVR